LAVTGRDPHLPQERAIRTSLPFEPAPGTVNHLITGRLRPDLKRTVAFGLLALIVAAAVRIYGDLSWSSLGEGALTASGCLLFVALAVLAVRSGASEVAAVSRTRFGDAHAAVVALLLTLAGYAATVMSLLVLLQVPVGRLLVSGAVTGVVLGVAAQQSLGNVVRSGALAGPYTGQVLSIGLTYVQLDTDDGLILLPNSGVLAAAVGPRADTPEQH